MQLLSAKARITGQENMLDTSAIRGILWLVLRSEDAYPAVNGVDMYQLVSQSLMQEYIYKTRKKGRKRAYLISETYFIDLRPLIIRMC